MPVVGEQLQESLAVEDRRPLVTQPAAGCWGKDSGHARYLALKSGRLLRPEWPHGEHFAHRLIDDAATVTDAELEASWAMRRHSCLTTIWLRRRSTCWRPATLVACSTSCWAEPAAPAAARLRKSFDQGEQGAHSDGDVPRVLLRGVPVVMLKDLTGIGFSTANIRRDSEQHGAWSGFPLRSGDVVLARSAELLCHARSRSPNGCVGLSGGMRAAGARRRRRMPVTCLSPWPVPGATVRRD
ncbi:DUF6000 family protein [Streptomyces sp. NPDC056084]|uniref:DUF6000 family protein n=1 Tax=Streptomyces sp. NPDC056084 TaxID=3345707 RepID=UPI0035D638D4